MKKREGAPRRSALLLQTGALLLAAHICVAQSTVFGNNLIANGDAEAGPAAANISTVVASIPSWTRSGTVTVLPYDLTGFVQSTDPAPPDRHFQYFSAASHALTTSTLTQDIDVSAGAAAINAGNVKFTASAYLGSADGGETAQMAVAFRTAAGQTFNTITLGPLGPPGGLGRGMSLQQQIGLVPSGTMRITVTLSLASDCPNAAECLFGAADSLALVLTPLTPPAPLVLGTNLVVNGDAETGAGVPSPKFALNTPGWSTSAGASVEPYGSASIPGPDDRGVNVFYGGPVAGTSDMYQDIDVSPAGTMIDGGQIQFELSAWLGALAGHQSPTVTCTFFDWSGKQLAPPVQLGPFAVSATSLALRTQSGSLISGTRRVHIDVSFHFGINAADTGGSLADDFIFVLNGPGPGPTIDPTFSVQNQTAAPNAPRQVVAPGSLVAIYGNNLATVASAASAIPLSPSLGGLSVTFNGVAAPMVGIAPGVKVGTQSLDQINAIVPWEVTPGVVPVVITRGAVSSPAMNIQVAASSPGIFYIATDNSGVNRPLAYNNSDNTFAYPAGSFGTSLNTRPASISKDAIVVWCTGLGTVTVTPPDGAPATNSAGQFVESDTVTKPVVLVGNRQATVTFSGLTQYPSIYQINITLDPATPTGDAVPIQIQMNGVTTTDQLKIAVTK